MQQHKATERAIAGMMTTMRKRLELALSLSRSAESLARSQQEEAIAVALDVEQPVHEAISLLNAAVILHRQHPRPRRG